MSIIFPTAVAAIVISLHGLLLPHRAKASVEYGLIYGDKFSPMEYAFECFGFSIPPHDMFRKLTGPLFRHCTVPDIATVGGSAQLGDPLKVKYQFHYKCSRPMSRSSWNPPVLRCVPENDCDSCVSIYSEALCQYDVVSLSRLWNGCTPIADEITKIDSTEDGGEIVMDLIQGRIIEAADNRNPGNHVSGRPYCDDAKKSMVIHPCFVAPVLIVVDKMSCLQKVTCGSRVEQNVPFKLNWSAYQDAWDKLAPISKRALDRALHRLVKCTNATVSDSQQCGRCKAQRDVARLYDDGYTMKV